MGGHGPRLGGLKGPRTEIDGRGLHLVAEYFIDAETPIRWLGQDKRRVRYMHLSPTKPDPNPQGPTLPSQSPPHTPSATRRNTSILDTSPEFPITTNDNRCPPTPPQPTTINATHTISSSSSNHGHRTDCPVREGFPETAPHLSRQQDPSREPQGRQGREEMV